MSPILRNAESLHTCVISLQHAGLTALRIYIGEVDYSFHGGRIQAKKLKGMKTKELKGMKKWALIKPHQQKQYLLKLKKHH